jgi:hypothetical protein
MNMDSHAWMDHVTSGDRGASTMYDTAWSVCYALVHGGKQYRSALEQYLGLINRTTPPAKAFDTVFGQNVDTFQKAWEKGLDRMEPDPWFTSVRHLQLMAIALKALHARHVELKSFDQLKEVLARARFRAEVRERDAVARRDEKPAKVKPKNDPDDDEKKASAAPPAPKFDFPEPATAELIPSTDDKLPPGLLVTGVKPTLKLTWRVNDAGAVEEDIDCEGK